MPSSQIIALIFGSRNKIENRASGVFQVSKGSPVTSVDLFFYALLPQFLTIALFIDSIDQVIARCLRALTYRERPVRLTMCDLLHVQSYGIPCTALPY